MRPCGWRGWYQIVVHDFLNHEVVPMGLTYCLGVTVIPARMPGSTSSLRRSSKNALRPAIMR